MLSINRFTIAFLLVVNCLTIAHASSYLYLEQSKEINGSYRYYLPKLELNQQKFAGKLFGTPCFYLSEFDGGLVYTAPRGNAMALNHHSIQAEWHFGVEIKPFWVTYSIGGRQYLAGNDDAIPAGLEMLNTARVGIEF